MRFNLESNTIFIHDYSFVKQGTISAMLNRPEDNSILANLAYVRLSFSSSVNPETMNRKKA
jgi:hypothetical protein